MTPSFLSKWTVCDDFKLLGRTNETVKLAKEFSLMLNPRHEAKVRDCSFRWK